MRGTRLALRSSMDAIEHSYDAWLSHPALTIPSPFDVVEEFGFVEFGAPETLARAASSTCAGRLDEESIELDAFGRASVVFELGAHAEVARVARAMATFGVRIVIVEP